MFFPVRSCSGDAWAPKDDFVEVDATCGEDFQGLLHIWLHVSPWHLQQPYEHVRIQSSPQCAPFW